MTRNEIARKL